MKNRKNLITLALVGMMVFCMTGCGNFVTDKLAEMRLEGGNQYLEAGSYEEAIAAYEQVLNMDKYQWDAYTGLVEAMLLKEVEYTDVKAVIEKGLDAAFEKYETGIGEEEADELKDFFEAALDAALEDFSLTLDILISTNDVLPEDDTWEDAYVQALEKGAQNAVDNIDCEKADDLINRLKEKGGDEDQIARLEEQNNDNKENGDAYIDVLLAATTYIELGDWEALADYQESEEVASLMERIGDKGQLYYQIPYEENKVIGYFSMEGCKCDQWYYGELVDGQREGDGTWVFVRQEKAVTTEGESIFLGYYIDVYAGQWKEDKPNGTGNLFISSRGNVMKDLEVTVVDGLVDGSYIDYETDEKGNVWEFEYTVSNGEYVPVEPEADWVGTAGEGKMFYSIAYQRNADGEPTSARVLITRLEDKFGIAHFRD